MSSLFSYKGIRPKLGKNVYIDNNCVLVGDISIGDDSSIWPLVAARGDVNHIVIGNKTNIQDGSVLHVTHKDPDNPKGFPLIIGNEVTIGHKVMLHGCTIGDRVLVGMGAIVLDGVIIEPDVMVGAGSLVTPGKTLQSGYLYMGSPARAARELTKEEISSLRQSAANYVETKDEYLTDVVALN